MLSESFIASTAASTKAQASATLRDVGVCVHEFQPASSLRTTFKKSSTAPNCLAVSPSHVFAAQSEKAIVHVYSREKGNQEATVPFPERIRSVAIADGKNGDVLVLGTEGGRLLLWETCTGRQVATTASHLSPVTVLAVDPSNNFILSGSQDASIHVWSLFDLLSFTKPSSGRDRQPPNSPIRTFSNHRAGITSLAVGHSTGRYNVVVSASNDNTAIAWDYHTGSALRTYLLPASAVSLALDPVDRAFYAGYEDGSIQSIDFYKSQSPQHPLRDQSLQSIPVQLPGEARWTPPSPDCGAAHALTLSYDGTVLLSGHQNGKVLSWNVGRKKYATTVADYTHPVTNLWMLPPSGLPHPTRDIKRMAHTVVKPRYDSTLSESSHAYGTVPADYTFSTHLLPTIPSINTNTKPQPDEFTTSLTHAFFPTSLLEEGLAELSLHQSGTTNTTTQPAPTTSSDLTLDTTEKDTQISALETELSTLRSKVSVTETARQASTDENTKLRSDLVNLHDYIDSLHQRQEQAQRERIARLARKEEREALRREAWFAAEKKGKRGDAAVKKIDVEESVVTSDSDDMSDDE